ncbi:amidohydrolase [Halococcus hamelinensis]|uniref:Amidohydrolase n=1 Tax=Halococcus hamelinensis 100A6 TaxID=1132509 RepID=M0M857_9EURY|nr:amidohydrolase [Halococcus hamelinensis]EMA40804.1 amidohydrolase [Halococcus hamelinensis 100A6]
MAADLVLTNAEIHTLTDPDDVHEALAVRDGRVVRLGSAYEVAFLEGVETRTIDLEGRVLLPGFVDAHTHLTEVGTRLVHADLSGAGSAAEAVSRLADRADETDAGWVQGYGYDESGWSDARYLDRDDLDGVSTDRPVVAFREDMHTAGINGVALDRLGDRLPVDDVLEANGVPTGVVVEDALGPVREAIAPDVDETRDRLRAAIDHANACGVTGIHDLVRHSHAPRVYRDLRREGDLSLRVRINYWSDHLDALREVGLGTDDGDEFVRTGAIKSFTDGSFGGRTAKLSEPYADGEGSGKWVVSPSELHDLVERADADGYQFTAHAIGDAAIDAVLDAYEATEAGAARHRIEHVELPSESAIERLAETGVVASVQPNFLKWAGEDGLYESRLGTDRRRRSNPFRDLLDAGVHLAFGSDSMPLDPLFGVQQAVNAPVEGQRLTVTEALRAYTHGAAYAGFDEDRLGTVEPGKAADFTVLDSSPWDEREAIADIDVAMTVVDGAVVHDAR